MDKPENILLEESLRFRFVTAMGVPGSWISAASDYGQSTKPLISRYQNIPPADLIVVFMGTNAYGHETPLGSVEYTGDGREAAAKSYIADRAKEGYILGGKNSVSDTSVKNIFGTNCLIQ